jgi:glycosyltransferase involved in cell wall biosynthesis
MSIELSGQNTKKEIWIVSELFYPETISTGYILTEVAKSLAKNFEISVITGPEFYEEKDIEKKYPPLDSITIKRIKSNGYDKNSFYSRIKGHILVSLKMLFLMCKYIPRNAEVLMVTNPILLLAFVSVLCRSKKWNIKLLVHDVFPENLLISGVIKSKKSVVYKIIKTFFNNAFSYVDTLIVLGRDMQELYKEKVGKNKNIIVIENWADTQAISLHENTNKKINFLFAGNLGRLQGLESLMISLLETKNLKYEFTFIGSGALDQYINSFIDENELKHVNKFGWLDREKQDEFMKMASIGVVSLKKGMLGLGVPSKFYNLLAAGKPIFYIGDVNSEIYKVLQEHHIGWFAESGNTDMVVNVIKEIIKAKEEQLEIYSKNARKLAVDQFNKEIILNKFNNIFA